MSQYLSLSRAARLAGVSRGELQEKIRCMGLPTFEGKIDVEQLLKAYPEVDMDRDPVLERLQLIKADARPKKQKGDSWLPEPEVLMSRLHDFQRVLIRTKTALNTAEQLVGEVADRLEHAATGSEAELRATTRDLGARLRRSLEKSERIPDTEAELFAKDALLRIVSASVRISPSGHEFFVEGRDSLLGAALKSGLHLDYGCSSGNCGACRVKVLSGRVRKIRDHDYVLTGQERDAGFVLACSNTAVTDVVLEASEALTATDLPHQRIRCSLRGSEPVSDSLTLVRMQTPRTQTLRFMAGQRVRLTTESGSSRSLPVASCPCDARNLQFLVNRRPADDFCDALLSGTQGQTVLLEGPEGEFLLQEEARETALFVAVGEGFAPIRSLIEHAISIDNAARLQLYRVDENRPGNLLDNLCRSWHDALDNFGYRLMEPTSAPAVVLGQLLEEFPEIGECQLYVAGPAEWVKSFVSDAGARGASEARLHYDVVE